MKKLLELITILMIVSLNSAVGAWYATYYNGDLNYVLANGRMGGCNYVKLDSVKEEFKDDDVSILSFDKIMVYDASMCDLNISDKCTKRYKFDVSDMKMYDLNNDNPHYFDLSGVASNYRGATLGEIAYTMKYGSKFYGLLNDGEYFSDNFYRSFIEKKLDGVPNKILGRWDVSNGDGYFEINNDMIKHFDSNCRVVSSSAIVSVVGLDELQGIGRYKFNVDENRNFVFYYYDLAKQKLLVSGDGKLILCRTSNCEIGESLGGIFIGMPIKIVIDLYGMPTKTVEQNCYIKNHYFDNDLMMITECAGYVARVQISPGSKKILEKSGLGVETKTEFEKIYEPYFRMKKDGEKFTYPNRFIAGESVVVVKQRTSTFKNLILVAASWLE